MPTVVGWSDIAQRLAFALLAGVLIGFNRWERGRAAGLRTITLVCVAAAVAMIQTNILLTTAGKTSSSFAQFDVMRLPLGILSGMGFIGGGAILRREEAIIGVTTAATLWFATIIGLCFGGGQTALGFSGLCVCLAVLWLFHLLEQRLNRERLGTLTLTIDPAVEDHVESYLAGRGFRIVSFTVRQEPAPGTRELRCQVRWTTTQRNAGLPPFLRELEESGEFLRIEWSEVVRSEA